MANDLFTLLVLVRGDNLTEGGELKILCMSDTHGMHREAVLPHMLEGVDPDVVVHAGDCTGWGSRDELREFLGWYAHKFSDAKRVLIAGNHDACFEKHPEEARALCMKYGVIYLESQLAWIGGRLFYGSPYTPNFNNWHFMHERGSPELAAEWAKIPRDTEVLITHGPPNRTLDFSMLDHSNEGCGILADIVYNDLPDLKLHVFGHMHECYGEARDTEYGGDIVFVNAALANRNYGIGQRKPIMVEI